MGQIVGPLVEYQTNRMRHDLSDILTVPDDHTTWVDRNVVPELLEAGEDVTSGPAQEALIRLWVRGQTPGVDTTTQWRYTKSEGRKVLREDERTRTKRRELYFDELWWEDYAYSNGLEYTDGTTIYADELMLDVTPKYRRFVTLWALEGYSIRDAARTLGIGVRTGERWVSELRDTLQEKWRDLW